MGRARVLLAEDHPGVADELHRLLDAEFDVVAVVGDGNALLRVADDTRPDVVVTDIVMPGLDGISATEALLTRHPGSRVVLVTVHDDPELAERGYAAGALAYVAKHTAAHDLVPAVRMALRGERYRPPHVAPAPKQSPLGNLPSGGAGGGSEGGSAHEPGDGR
jgi:DNA-binding NarL/FixJ family response regulator